MSPTPSRELSEFELSASSEAGVRWHALEEHLSEWFHAPDLQALRITLAAGIAHRHRDENPVWMFVLGASGSGKTEIVINALSQLPETHKLDDISPNTFLSGFQPGKTPTRSFLHTHVGDSGIILIPDFSTFSSKRSEDKKEIASQLRRIYDGEYSKDRGSMEEQLVWTGKCTIIAAGTPSVERQWAVLRELGERFMQVRWRSGEGLAIGRAADKQVGHERYIRQELRDRTHDFLCHQPLGFQREALSIEKSGLLYLANIVAWLRQSVERDGGFGRQIVEVGGREAPTRIQKALSQIARGHADLFRRPVGQEDLEAAHRVACDSVPIHRWEIFRALWDGRSRTTSELLLECGMPRATLLWQLEELHALKAVELRDIGEFVYTISPELLDLKERALL